MASKHQHDQKIIFIARDSSIQKTIGRIQDRLDQFDQVQLRCAGTAAQNGILISQTCINQGLAQYLRFTTQTIIRNQKQIINVCIKLKRPAQQRKNSKYVERIENKPINTRNQRSQNTPVQKYTQKRNDHQNEDKNDNTSDHKSDQKKDNKYDNRSYQKDYRNNIRYVQRNDRKNDQRNDRRNDQRNDRRNNHNQSYREDYKQKQSNKFVGKDDRYERRIENKNTNQSNHSQHQYQQKYQNQRQYR